MDSWGEAITAIGALVAIGTTLWKAARAYAKNELLADQAQATIAEKDKEIERWRRLVDHLTTPEADE